MTFELEEIVSPSRFEDLVAAYFEGLKYEQGYKFTDVVVKPSGSGPDGGRDILVTFRLKDGIQVFERRWVVQCKFLGADVSTNKLADINLPTLVHSYNACGYLLVCKQRPTSKLTALFERLSARCHNGYLFEVWSGEQFKRQILSRSDEALLMQYFPKYFETLKKSYNFERDDRKDESVRVL